MRQLESLCYRKNNRRKDLTLLNIHAGQRGALAQAIDVAASGAECGNGES